MAKLKDHRVLSDGWVLGLFRKAGEILPMSEAQAKYEPNVEPVENDAETDPKPAKTTRRGKSSEDKADA